MPQLKNDWRDVLRYAWSIRFIALSALLSAVEFIIPVFMENPPLPRGLFAVLAFAVSVAAFFARIVAQRNLRA